MARPKSFNFQRIIVGAPEDSERPTISITKTGQMIISAAADRKFGLDGSLVEIVYEPEKNALGWRKRDDNRLPESEWTKTTRLLKSDPKTGLIRVAIGRIMNSIYKKGMAFKRLPVEEYSDVMERDRVYYVLLNGPTMPKTYKRRFKETLD